MQRCESSVDEREIYEGQMTNPDSTASTRLDPRAVRSRARALSQARELVADGGVTALTYSSLAAASGLSRQTLYQHWPTIAALIRDLLHEGPPTDYPQPGPDARVVIRAFLSSFRAGMTDRATAAAFSSLIGQAEQDPLAEQQLRDLVDNRRAALTELLVQTEVVITEERMSRLTGPVIFRRFVHRQPVTDDFLDDVVDAFFRSLAVDGAN
jgi:AcrR family transcriptional regulator